jgi:N utilization substance protein B
MQLLYQWELQGKLSRKHEITPNFIDNINLEAFLGHFLHNFYQKDKTAINIPMVIDLVHGSIKAMVKIDRAIDEASVKWKLARMEAIDRAILRLASYELLIKKQISPRVIINDAIEIAKRFGKEQSASFVNAVLDSLNHSP